MKQETKNAVVVELYDWNISNEKNDRIGRVIKSKSIDVDDLVGLIVSRGTNLSASTIKAAFELMKEMAIEQVANGASVNFGLGHFQLKVNGVFHGDHDKWDNEKHRLSIKVTPGTDLTRAVQACEVKVRGKAASSIAINTLTDITTGLVNTCLTPGGGVNVCGKRIKIEGEPELVGICLRNMETNCETQIPASAMMMNTSSQISFVTPKELPSGHYQLVICTQYSGKGRLLKKAKVYEFGTALLVN